THGSILSKRATFGLSVNNNPTVQDVWNSTPAWGFPYGSSAVAPTPGAATLIDGTLGQQVAGLTAYTMWNDRVYGEFGAYRSAPLGIQRPLNASATGVISGAAPYWGLAFRVHPGPVRHDRHERHPALRGEPYQHPEN